MWTPYTPKSRPWPVGCVVAVGDMTATAKVTGYSEAADGAGVDLLSADGMPFSVGWEEFLSIRYYLEPGDYLVSPNGDPICATLDRILATARHRPETVTYDPAGLEQIQSEIAWDTAEAERGPDGKATFICTQGRYWRTDQLVPRSRIDPQADHLLEDHP